MNRDICLAQSLFNSNISKKSAELLAKLESSYDDPEFAKFLDQNSSNEAEMERFMITRAFEQVATTIAAALSSIDQPALRSAGATKGPDLQITKSAAYLAQKLFESYPELSARFFAIKKQLKI